MTVSAARVTADGTAPKPFWIGLAEHEARAAYYRARLMGMTELRSLIIGSIASYPDGWMFRKRLAKRWGCDIRTVQRAITQAKSLGLLRTARGGKTEIPKGASGPRPCGWSHRWIIGRGKAGKELHDAIVEARAKYLRWLALKSNPPRLPVPLPKQVYEPGKGIRTPYQRRDWTAAELDAELARLELLKRPPE